MTTPKIKWTTTSVTALPPGMSVTLRDKDDGSEFTWPAVALLQQTGEGAWHGDDQRLTLGLLNLQRGEVEPLEVDDDEPGVLVSINLDDDGMADSLRAIEQSLRDRWPRPWRFTPDASDDADEEDA